MAIYKSYTNRSLYTGDQHQGFDTARGAATGIVSSLGPIGAIVGTALTTGGYLHDTVDKFGKQQHNRFLQDSAGFVDPISNLPGLLSGDFSVGQAIGGMILPGYGSKLINDKTEQDIKDSQKEKYLVNDQLVAEDGGRTRFSGYSDNIVFDGRDELFQNDPTNSEIIADAAGAVASAYAMKNSIKGLKISNTNKAINNGTLDESEDLVTAFDKTKLDVFMDKAFDPNNGIQAQLLASAQNERNSMPSLERKDPNNPNNFIDLTSGAYAFNNNNGVKKEDNFVNDYYGLSQSFMDF